MVDLAAIAGAISSSGVAVLLYNLYESKKADRAASKVESRLALREPAILDSLNLNATKRVVERLERGLDEVVEAKKRQADDFLIIHQTLENNVTNLANENASLHA